MNLIRIPPSPQINVGKKFNALDCCVVTHCRSCNENHHNLHPFQHWFRGKGGFFGQFQCSPIYFGEDCLHFGIFGKSYLVMIIQTDSLNDSCCFQCIGNDRMKGAVDLKHFLTLQLMCCMHWWRHQWRQICDFLHKVQ